MSRDATVLRAYQRGIAFAAQRAYAAMSEPAQRRYAARHPSFMARFGNVVPEHVRFLMVDAGDDDAADAIWSSYVHATQVFATQRDLARSRVSPGERVIWVAIYVFLACIAACLLTPAAYAIAGRHGAFTLLCALAPMTVLTCLWRLCSGVR